MKALAYRYKFTYFFLFSNRFMDSVTVLTTPKERIASNAKQVIMTDHGDLQLLKTPTNVEVCIFLSTVLCIACFYW